MKAENNKLKRETADLQKNVNELQQIISALNSKVNELEELNKKQCADNDYDMDLKVDEIIVLSTQLEQLKTENSMLIDEVQVLDAIALGDKKRYRSDDEHLEEAAHEITQRYAADGTRVDKGKHVSSIVRGIKENPRQLSI